MAGERLLLLGCGILDREIAWLIRKNGWPLDTCFLDSALHVDFEELSRSLKAALAEHRGRDIVVFYGACHPRMETMVAEENTFRCVGQNCLEMLLGEPLFTKELANGAFFLLEDWARRWNHIITKTFGKNLQIVRDIFQGDRRYLLCLRTPCSGPFEAEAEEAGTQVGLPIRWMDVGLDHLESVLQVAITRRIG